MSNLFERFSSKENLKKAFLYLKDEADESTLPLDPIWRPAISAIANLGDDFFLTLQEYLRQDKYQPDGADYFYADKDNMGVRPICVFSVVDRIVFQALLNPLILGNTIDKKLYSTCLGNRILGKDKYLRLYKIQWAKFCDGQIAAFKKKFVWRVEFDVQTFFESIHIGTLLNILSKDFHIDDERILTILAQQLTKWSETPVLCGVPQGANASQVLANAYLYPLDIFLDELKSSGDFEYFRYVDDTVILAKSPDKINHLVAQIEIFLRKYNLRINEKTKLEKLKGTQEIEMQRYYSPYGHVNEPSRDKIKRIGKQIPKLLRKIIKGAEVKKREMSGLKYYLKAGAGMLDPEILDDLIKIIPRKPSLIYLISRYLGFYFSDLYRILSPHELTEYDKEFYRGVKEFNNEIYQKVWEVYRKNSFTDWARFWLLKILSAALFSQEYSEFQTELDKIAADINLHFLKPLVFFYRAHARQVNPFQPLGFNSDDIKRHIRNSRTETEKAIYYYFAVYLSGIEDAAIVKELLYDALQSKSAEVQTMGLFLLRKLYHLFEATPAEVNNISVITKWNIKLEREITGEFSRIFLGLPSATASKETKEIAATTDFLTFEGKIAKDQFSQFLGMGAPAKQSGSARGYKNKLNFYSESGEAEYKTAVWPFKGKARALLDFFINNKNAKFNVGDIQGYCNPNISIERHKFRAAKDINDTLREIRMRLKVGKGVFFPLLKEGKGWILVDK